MTGHDDEAEHQDDGAVRELIGRLGVGGSPTATERARMAEAMWVAAEESSPTAGPPILAAVLADSDEPQPASRSRSDEARPGRRLLFWAAVFLVALAAVGTARRSVTVESQPSNQVEEGRTTLDLGGATVSFDTLQHYDRTREGRYLVHFAARSASIRSHERITLAHPSVLFDDRDPEDFFASADLETESIVGQEDASAWLATVTPRPGCNVGEPCVTVAVLPDGSTIKLAVGGYYLIALHPVQNGSPILVLSEAGSSAPGPALVDVDISN